VEKYDKCGYTIKKETTCERAARKILRGDKITKYDADKMAVRTALESSK